MAQSQTIFQYLLLEENSILLVCAAKVRLLKLQEADHKQDADKLNPTHAQQATYTANKQSKEEVGCIELNRNFEQPLQHVGMHYAAER